MKNYCELETPIGTLTIVEEKEMITEIIFGKIKDEPSKPKEILKKVEEIEKPDMTLDKLDDSIEKSGINLEELDTPLLKEAKKQLLEYFAKTRTEFQLPCNPKGTEFQKEVWKELQKIPYGETRTYQEIAFSIGNVRACRSVGRANHENPIPILIPCHRVIGKNNQLLGYAGGMPIKEFLLRLEGSQLG